MKEGQSHQAAIAAALAVLHLAESRREATRQERLAEATAIIRRAIEEAAPPALPRRLAVEPSMN